MIHGIKIVLIAGLTTTLVPAHARAWTPGKVAVLNTQNKKSAANSANPTVSDLKRLTAALREPITIRLLTNMSVGALTIDQWLVSPKQVDDIMTGSLSGNGMATSIGRRLNARYVIDSTLFKFGAGFTVLVKVYDVNNSKPVFEKRVNGGDLDRLSMSLAALSRELAPKFEPESGKNEESQAALQTSKDRKTKAFSLRECNRACWESKCPDYMRVNPAFLNHCIATSERRRDSCLRQCHEQYKKEETFKQRLRSAQPHLRDSLYGLLDSLQTSFNRRTVSQLNTRGWYALQNGDADTAEWSFRAGLEKAPNNIYLRSNMAHVYIFRGDETKAWEIISRLKDRPFKEDNRFSTVKDAFIDDFKIFKRKGSVPQRHLSVFRRIWRRLENSRPAPAAPLRPKVPRVLNSEN